MTTCNVRSKLELVAHLYRRAGFGATPSELENVAGTSYEDVVDQLMTFSNIDFVPEDLICRFHKDQSDLREAPAAGAQWIYRMVMTENPMREKMCLFCIECLLRHRQS